MILRILAASCLSAILLLIATAGPSAKPLLASGLVASNIMSDTTVTTGTKDGSLLYSDFVSSVLGYAPPYRIYLPPGYSTSADRYPVLYLLHGNGSDYTEWTDNEKIDYTAGYMITHQQIKPMIIVMPTGEHSYFMNLPGGLRWADYITRDLVPHIDANYRTIADREHRAIGGLSMGANGALQLAFNHPDLFSIVGAHSPSLFLSPVGAPDFMADWNYYAEFDPIRLASTKSNLQTLQIWLDVGVLDAWRGGTELLHTALSDRGIDQSWNAFPGQHEAAYWISHSPDYLSFYATAFDRGITTPTPTPTTPPVLAASTVVAPTSVIEPAPAIQLAAESADSGVEIGAPVAADPAAAADGDVQPQDQAAPN